MKSFVLVLGFVLGVPAGLARAADVPIVPTKLVITDTTAAGGSAKVIVVSKDAALAKGAGTDPASISATMRIAFDGAAGEFVMPEGAAWLKTTDDTARYQDSTAPASGSVRLHLVKVGKVLKLKAAALGEIPLDISVSPTGEVSLAETIVNGAETTRLCGKFSSCTHKVIAGGLGYKLVCKTGEADPDCSAVPTSSTTTSSTTTTLDIPTTTLDVTTTTITTTTLNVTTTTLDVPTTTTSTTLDATTTTTVEITTTTTLPFCIPEETESCSTGQPGICAAGTRACNLDGTAYGACTPLTPGFAELCIDGLDNDCDGVADDGCVCPLGTPESCNTGLTGFCAAGTRICQGTSWGACNPNAPVSADVCDYLDNDCDGETDEGCVCPPNSSAICSTGMPGPCDVGLKTCSGDGSGYGSCSQIVGPSEETCGDSVDNDCDGATDEDCTTTTSTTSTTLEECGAVVAPPVLAPGTFILLTRGEDQFTRNVLPALYSDEEANALANADPATFDASNFIDPAVCGSTVDDLTFHWEIRYPAIAAITNPFTLAGITGYRRARLEVGANTTIIQISPPVTFRLTVTSRLTGLSTTVDILSQLSESSLTLNLFNSCKGQSVACPSCTCKVALALPTTEPT